jgi:hypothetical protein
MTSWFRVFGTNDIQLEPEALLEHLRQSGLEVTGHFRGDALDWFSAELRMTSPATTLEVERFLGSEEGIRAELNTWAAWLETCADHPQHLRLMQHMIGTTQLFTICQPGDGEDESVRNCCLTLCRFLAQQTAGVYQVDDRGFFAANGDLLVPQT